MRIGCGCVNLGSASSALSPREQMRLVHEAIDSNVRVFDTADAYGGGASERVLGRAVRDRRDDVTISTKGGYCFRPRSAIEQRVRGHVASIRERGRSSRSAVPESDIRSEATGSYQRQDFTEHHLRRALEASLRRLGTDYVDVYLLHGPVCVDDGILAALEDLRASGKVRAFGVGAESAASAMRWYDRPRVGVVQAPFGVLDPWVVDRLDRGSPTTTQLWARGVLAGGVLAAAMTDLARAASHPKYATIVGLSSVADRFGLALDELAVRWVAHHDEIDTMLIGISSSRHLRRNVEIAAAPALPNDVCTAVDDVLRRTLGRERRC